MLQISSIQIIVQTTQDTAVWGVHLQRVEGINPIQKAGDPWC